MTFPQLPSPVGGPSSYITRSDLPPVPSQSRERFFPPPFRIDRTDEDLETSDAESLAGPSSRVALPIKAGSPTIHRSAPYLNESGPSHILPHQPQRSSPLRPPPKKRRKLLFTSQLPPSQAENEDGTPSVEHMRYRSTMRLKLKWDEIYERFKDAHLQTQDEIYLGRGKQKMRLIKDNGVIRAFKEELAFGSFHIKDEDLDDVARELKIAAGEDVDAEVYTEDETKRKKGAELALDSDEDELGVWDEAFVRSQYREFTAAPEGPEDRGESSEEEEELDPATMDPDLRAFLQEEAHRKELMGDEEGSDDEESVIDFREARWDRMRGTTPTSSEDSTDEDEDGEEDADDPPGSIAHRERATLYLSQPGQYDTSDDDLDVLDQDEGVLIPHDEASAARQRRGPLFPHGDWDTQGGQGGILTPDEDALSQAIIRGRRNVEALLSDTTSASVSMPHDEVPDLVEIFGMTALSPSFAKTERMSSPAGEPSQPQGDGDRAKARTPETTRIVATSPCARQTSSEGDIGSLDGQAQTALVHGDLICPIETGSDAERAADQSLSDGLHTPPGSPPLRTSAANIQADHLFMQPSHSSASPSKEAKVTSRSYSPPSSRHYGHSHGQFPHRLEQQQRVAYSSPITARRPQTAFSLADGSPSAATAAGFSAELAGGSPRAREAGTTLAF
ncbi:hypothetical protein BCV69DRAFT_281873 [Microstroma glucosiphilum]|uniref:Uncharacterized protein n=1 Tax=Pseudomicrostroma glucosiphilum TaxID=1684307 RepID=A0A316UFQ0_9BASI|nr:hypothetical protein BCV69DRAFT_281873 [Pseudomicrostroma glucosiphilum]PWN21965.1 hypothetical protein BCV69DRAFT_281873 [Pseudomicrostroma glucosiphilum]